MTVVASSAVGRSVRAVSGALIHPGGHAKTLSLLGTDTLVFYRFDATEHARRQRAGMKALTGMARLETLLILPVDMPVPLGSLHARDRAAVRRLPAGSASRDRHEVTRHAVRPLHVDLAVVTAEQPRRGLEAATRFAPFCSRAVLLRRPAPRMDDFLNEASFYGVGVLVDSPSGIEMVLEPRLYRPQRHTAAAWNFTEELYQRVR
ncbi:hypothetical protein C5F59_039165 [Streptomyces sp. QL37]|uniref:hypothetical protein n=1 Tax=Streptomyces sp. QL37 TaxID=2093747 RepID=UPI000CF1FFC3|nr:hypothetical protein [Streptomyces sp. QL37]PPQ62040.1 hypothetical protein C5F59_39405 [Streptomyces sp. QL37]